MLNTYKAVLKGNRLEWMEEGPELATEEEAVAVHVTILDQTMLKPRHSTQGQEMAAALERLATRNALANISDPVSWQRETRQDRGLPNRDV